MARLPYVALCLAVMAGPGFAQGMSGLELKKLCENTKSNVYPLCMSWVAGLFEGLSAMDQMDRQPQVCPPAGLSNKQLQLVILKWLGDHPAELHNNSGRLATVAIYEAFKCQKGGAQ